MKSAELSTMTMRYLSIDFGSRRTGLAICDASETLVSPLKQIDVDPRRPEKLMDQIKKIVAENQVGAMVVGLPLNMDGTPGPQAAASERFAEKLGREVGIPVHLYDERLSTAAAEEKLAGITGLSARKKKAKIDMLAACEILQDFIDQLHHKSTGPA
jgi:putative holliday junction resolvase